MPGFTTHYLFGQQTYQLLPASASKRNIQKNHTAFSLGLQGPDIFFYDILSLLLAKKNPGSIAHTADTRKFLRYLLDSPKIFPTKKEQEIAHAYILGYIGHYLLDAVCHPYVYAMTRYNQKRKGYMGQHVCLETNIDTTLLWYYQRRHPSEFHQHETIALSKEQCYVISTLLYYAFSKTYPNLGPTRHRILQAIYGMQLATRLLYDPTGRKKALLRRIESVIPGYPMLSSLVPSDLLIFHKDPCNMKHNMWKNPWEEELCSKESFFDLFEKAQDEYCSMLKYTTDFFSATYTPAERKKAIFRLLEQLGNRCYHSGLDSDTYLR